MTERRDTFDVVTDNRETYTFLTLNPFGEEAFEASKYFDRSYEKLAEHSQVFALLNELPHVVIGIEDRDELKVIRTPTEIHLNGHKTDVRKLKKVLTPAEAPNFVDVATMVVPMISPCESRIDAIAYKIEQRGYWKKLRSDQNGVGKNGDSVLGRTWTTVQETWEETVGFSPPENDTSVVIRPGSSSDQQGEIYVMRSPQHPKDVYKVGFTTKTSDDRALQLSTTFGQPDHFGVMHSWSVKRPRQVEAIVHERLAQFRVNKRREFFCTKYYVINSVIETVISELDASLSDELTPATTSAPPHRRPG